MLPSKNPLLLVATLMLSLMLTGAHADTQDAGAHEHGVGGLDLAFDGSRLEIGFTAPGSDLVGFEGTPADYGDTAKVQATLAALDNAPSLFGFEPEGACLPSDPADIDAPVAALQVPGGAAKPVEDPARAHHEHDHSDEYGATSTGHGDWRVSYTFDCRTPAAVNVNLFDVFPSLRTLRAQYVGPSVQSGADLTPAARRIELGGAR